MKRMLKKKILPKMGLEEFIKAKCTQGMYEINYIDDSDSLQISIIKTGDVIEHETDDTE